MRIVVSKDDDAVVRKIKLQLDVIMKQLPVVRSGVDPSRYLRIVSGQVVDLSETLNAEPVHAVD